MELLKIRLSTSLFGRFIYSSCMCFGICLYFPSFIMCGWLFSSFIVCVWQWFVLFRVFQVFPMYCSRKEFSFRNSFSRVYAWARPHGMGVASSSSHQIIRLSFYLHGTPADPLMDSRLLCLTGIGHSVVHSIWLVAHVCTTSSFSHQPIRPILFYMHRVQWQAIQSQPWADGRSFYLLVGSWITWLSIWLSSAMLSRFLPPIGVVGHSFYLVIAHVC